ncbi:hypothetical protein [Scytonema sp. HK-05]|uniref:hypothetical protein n=1 Tax=Scytonema sp. HK-05 TaxID=1137095 RepID=UPI000A86FCBA|nr:hypothetical protein [Scytonema sp. HK-05]
MDSCASFATLLPEPPGWLTQYQLIDIASTTETFPGQPHCYGLRVHLQHLPTAEPSASANHSAFRYFGISS